MKHKIKSFLTTPFVCLILIISMFALPVSANAEAGTLGTETPEISCIFTDSTGKNVDGNRLVKGQYTVDIVLTGMKAVSVVELTATYDQSVISAISIKSTYADTHEDMKKGGQKYEGNKLSVFQLSENDDASLIDTNGTVMVSLSVTVASSCDFTDVFTFSTDPDECFIEASYLDGLDDCYVLDTTVSTSYKTYPMTADASPYYRVTEFDVNGTVTVAADLEGTASVVPVAGVTVAIEEIGISTVTATDGSFVFADLAEGEYTLKISGPTTIDRTVKLVVALEKADYDQITVDSIGICVVDYNKDTKINATDVALFSKERTDLNGDGTFDDHDVAVFKTFLRKTVSYTQLTL